MNYRSDVVQNTFDIDSSTVCLGDNICLAFISSSTLKQKKAINFEGYFSQHASNHNVDDLKAWDRKMNCIEAVWNPI